MSLLKTYIREIIKEYLYEQASATPRLPEIPPSTSGGAVGKDNTRLNQARVKFADAALNYINQYNQILNTTRRFEPNATSRLYGVVDQILQSLRTDTNSWTNIPREIETDIAPLMPQNSALTNIRDNTEWAHTYNPNEPPNQQELTQKYQLVLTSLPQVITALQAYKTFYNK